MKNSIFNYINKKLYCINIIKAFIMELKKSESIPILKKKKNLRFSENEKLFSSRSYLENNKKISDCEYEMEIDPIGKGSFAFVYKGIDCYDGKEVAIKKISLDKLSKIKMDKFILELDLAVSLEHPNVLKSYKKLKTSRHWYIISEYCDEGTLVDVIKALKLVSSFEEKEKKIKNILVQLKDAMKYLIDRKILHRDIKPANILFKKEDNEIILKLADFGLSRYLEVDIEETDEDPMNMTVCGSPIYMAPEMIVDKKPCIKSDLWSFGVIMYEMLYGINPYNSPTSCDMLAKRMMNQKIVFREYYSKECLELVRSLLVVDPTNRIGWKDFFKSNWFNDSSRMIVHRNIDDEIQFDLELDNNTKTAPLEYKNKINITKSVNYDFDEDYVVINPSDIKEIDNEIYQSYSGSYIRIVSGLTSFWPFSKSY